MARVHAFRIAWLAASVALVGCSQAIPGPSPISAEQGRIVVRLGATDDGLSGSQSATLERVRVSQGARAFYAVHGGSYAATTTSPIEIWVEGSVSTGVPPRLVITWGDGGADNISCGACKLSHIYSSAGPQTVTVTLDDRVSAVEKWTFTLDVVPAGPGPLRLVFAPQPASVPIGTFVPFLVDALHTRTVPVTLECRLVCTAGLTCNIPLATTSGIGRAFTSNSVAVLGSAVTLELRCTASAEDATVSGAQQVIWQ